MINPMKDIKESQEYYEARAKWLGEIRDFKEKIKFNQKQVKALDSDFKYQPNRDGIEPAY